MFDDLNHLLRTWGYLALFLGTFLEGETILIVAGVLASRGRLNLHYAILAAFCGSMFGDQCVFLLARSMIAIAALHDCDSFPHCGSIVAESVCFGTVAPVGLVAQASTAFMICPGPIGPRCLSF